MQPTLDILTQLGIDYEVNVISAHRTPEKARQYGLAARERGTEVIIAAAGGAAHLPGVLASWTTSPVIFVPLAAGELEGVDALYSIVQMPAGIPVACVAVGGAGAKNETAPFTPQMTREQELDFLKNQADMIKNQLEQIEARIQELGTKES